jgi:SAM-dependent methyltransferase
MPAEFDRYADDYEALVDDAISFSGMDGDYFVEKKADLALRDEAGSGASSSVLDFGCGTGSLSGHLVDRVAHLSGADVSGEAVAQARRHVAGADFRDFDGVELPFDDDQFDLAIASCVFHHVDPGSWVDTAAEVNRVLRPGGRLKIFEHNPYNPVTRLAVNRCEFDRDAVLLTARRTKSVLERAGFVDVDHRYIFFVPIRHRAARAADRPLGSVPIGAQYLAVGTA